MYSGPRHTRSVRRGRGCAFVARAPFAAPSSRANRFGHHTHGPMSRKSEVTSTDRTANASSSTPSATAKPISAKTTTGRVPSAAKVPARTRPADVITAPVAARPATTSSTRGVVRHATPRTPSGATSSSRTAAAVGPAPHRFRTSPAPRFRAGDSRPRPPRPPGHPGDPPPGGCRAPVGLSVRAGPGGRGSQPLTVKAARSSASSREDGPTSSSNAPGSTTRLPSASTRLQSAAGSSMTTSRDSPGSSVT